MCGLIGAVGDISTVHERVVKYMLKLDVVRGPHSTGMLGVAKYNDLYTVAKELGTPWDGFLESKSYKAIDQRMSRLLMGHNRWATKGAITADNAHPFEWGNIIGCHNGTLRNQNLLLDSEQFEVDSDNLFYNLAAEGLEETAKKIHGAFALTWYDTKKQTFNIVKNSERTLYYTVAESNDVVFYASEPWILEVALQKERVKHREILAFADHFHYEWHVPELPWKKGSEKFSCKPRLKKIDFYVPPVRKTYQGYYGEDYYQPSKSSTFPVGNRRSSNDNATNTINIIGVRVMSTVEGVYKEAQNGLTYAKCKTPSGGEVRVFAGADLPEFHRMFKVGNRIKGLIKSRTIYNGDSYYKYKNSTICVEYVHDVNPPKQEVITNNIIPFEKKETTFRDRESTDSKEEDLTEDYLIVDGRRMLRKEYLDFVKDGCSHCGDPLDLMDHKAVKVDRDYNTPVCAICYNQYLSNFVH